MRLSAGSMAAGHYSNREALHLDLVIAAVEIGRLPAKGPLFWAVTVSLLAGRSGRGVKREMETEAGPFLLRPRDQHFRSLDDLFVFCCSDDFRHCKGDRLRVLADDLFRDRHGSLAGIFTE